MAQFYSQELEVKPKHHLDCSNRKEDLLLLYDFCRLAMGGFFVLYLSTHERKERNKKIQKHSVI